MRGLPCEVLVQRSQPTATQEPSIASCLASHALPGVPGGDERSDSFAVYCPLRHRGGVG